MKITWDLISKHIHPHTQLQEKLEEKVAHLGRFLQKFPQDAVHLHVKLEHHPKTALFTSALTLALPTGVLRSERTEADPIPAFDHAVKVLLREVESLKSHLRREDVRRAPEPEAL